MTTTTRKLVLGLLSGSDFTIRDKASKVYTLEEAKAAWEAGAIEDYNLAFGRLIRNGFDLEETKRQLAALR